MNLLLWLLVGLPSATGTLLALAGRAADRWAPGVAVVVSVVSLGLAVTSALHRPAVEAPFLYRLPLRLAVDGLSGVLIVTVTAVTLTVLLFSTAEFGADEARARFFGLMLLFAGSMLVTVTATTLPVLLMGWEVMGATSWALIGYWWREPERTVAADTAFLATRTADLGLYLAAGAALAAASGPLTLAGLASAPEPWLSFVTAGILVSALGKSAQLPFSFWLSKAMQGPSPVSALLHSAAMVVAGAYLLLRTGTLLAASGWGAEAAAWVGVATAVALGIVAVAQSDFKQLLAASTCAQIGFMVLAAGTGATTGGTLQLMAHAAAKSLLFLVAGVWLTAWGTQALPALRGAARSHRPVGVLCTVGALSLAGLPPLSLWAAKDVLLAGALGHGPWLYATGLAAAVLSAVYSVKIMWFVWRPVTPAEGGRRIPRGVVPPLALLAVACFALTPAAFPPVRDALTDYLDAQGQSQPHLWEFAVSGALALASAALAWAWGDRPLASSTRAERLCRGWLGLESAAHVLLVSPVLRIAEAAAVFDDRVLDRAVDTCARSTVALARWTNGSVERAVDTAVDGVATATRWSARWARRPQTGQLHQYLAQAVAAFSVIAVVLVLVR
ncbi:proton-conducting transporter membrane subunit [Streptomyces sp. NBC_00160]|uniref:NADH-quinone oxidoreductase subunit 5 family protein n=1 Tax=Streptomyces sp. NBC_00160 TaxID=2903628 RepID=UPI00225973A8|nr:proton-conducting transporter membrane subunit [Streptomyces sp. NBC_00160]MCX5302716.1 proton-conducting transporter membrane subunit [Streptomyces sp. NBC_00160]